MMLARCSLFAVLIPLLGWANSFGAEPKNFTKESIRDLQRFLDESVADQNFAVVVGLLDSDGTQFISAGTPDNGTGDPVDEHTIFEIGSITKTFTSLLLLEMNRRGEVNLDDPLQKYLPGAVELATFDGQAITLRHLGAQDSGLPFDADNLVGSNWWERYNAYTEDGLYGFLGRHELAVAPGAGFQYSNVGMAALGNALSRHAGQDFETLVVERICKPLRLDDTRINLSPEQKTRLAVGHDVDGASAPYYQFQVMEPAGALYSTGSDMMKYLSAQLGFSQSPLQPLMKQSQVLVHQASPHWGDTAMPWFNRGVYQPTGSVLLGHGGGTVGFSTFIGIDVGRKRGVAVLTSQRTSRAGRRVLVPAAIGWAVLQELPVTAWTSTQLVQEVFGFGTQLASDGGTGVSITRVFSASPAARAGLKPGCVLHRINGVDVREKDVQQCLRLMEGSSVELEYRFREETQVRKVELTRAKFLTLG